MAFGKKITFFFIEGDSAGRCTCELSNWTGMAYRIPRSLIGKCKDRDDLKGAGVYFLLGKTDDGLSDKVYIGEAENVYNRLDQHTSSKPAKEWTQWTECVAFINRGPRFNKANVKHLENKLYYLAKNCEIYDLANAAVPAAAALSESDEAEMDEYIENLRFMMGALGYQLFDQKKSGEKLPGTLYVIKNKGKEIIAKGKIVPDGFVVLKGSIAANECCGTYSTLMERLKDKESIDAKGIFTKDVLFSSYSAAAAIIRGRNSNGWLEWRTEDGVTLNDNELKPGQTTE